MQTAELTAEQQQQALELFQAAQRVTRFRVCVIRALGGNPDEPLMFAREVEARVHTLVRPVGVPRSTRADVIASLGRRPAVTVSPVTARRATCRLLRVRRMNMRPVRPGARRPARKLASRSARRSAEPHEPELAATAAGLTALQQALLPFVCSMELAADLGERELDSFVQIASTRLAREASRLCWWEEAA
jgi:hypothetical protein